MPENEQDSHYSEGSLISFAFVGEGVFQFVSLSRLIFIFSLWSFVAILSEEREKEGYVEGGAD